MPSTIGLAAMMALTTAASGGGEPTQPIRLEVDQSGDLVRLNVVGESAEAVEAQFTLEVASDGGGGVNRTSQSGRAKLTPGKSAQLIALSLSTREMRGWQATLTVHPAEGADYKVERAFSAQ